jgi:primosomal protein N' (replication factor Y)
MKKIQVAQIAVNVPHINGIFDYQIPEELAENVRIGSLVIVPFGKQKVQGIIVRLIGESDFPELRPILELLDPDPVITPEQISLAQWLSEQTFAPFSSCVDLMLPSGVSQHTDIIYTPLISTVPQNLDAFQQQIMEYLIRRGSLRGRQIAHAFPRKNWQASVKILARNGLLTTQSILQSPTVRPKFIRTVQLVCPSEYAQKVLEKLEKQTKSVLERRLSVINFLASESMPVEITWVYAETGCKLIDLQKLADLDLIALNENQIWRDPLADIHFAPALPPTLTQDQITAWEEIRCGFKQTTQGLVVKPYLLHGVTGSGKTEIYLRAVADVLQAGRQAIILVPEISLTPQTVRRFLARFPGQVGLIHSRLSPGENYDTWRRVRAGLISVIVGPRSALFMPFAKLGLIVVDECHDESYYQKENLPYYHTVSAAIAYARFSNAICILGSATPDIVSMHAADKGEYTRISLPARILAHREVIKSQSDQLGIKTQYHHFELDADSIDLPPVQVIDMRAELAAGNSSIFSRVLTRNISKILDANQQAILFLNRRGTATFVFCRDCGYSLRCPRCETPLTFHGSQALLTCHHCGYQRKQPQKCPNCESMRIRQYGTGTERVEKDLSALFPHARILRWDAESTREKGAHEIILSHFSAHRADILIGTQMLAKGLDLPLVTLVGIILAEVGLNLPDYRASERTFQLLTQVAGRAGRSPLGGQVILQTFQPDHYVIQSAADHDYKAFYQAELEYRRKLMYPPYYRLVRLEFRHANEKKVREEINRMAEAINERITAEDRNAMELIGPTPCFFARWNGLYRWQIILKGPDPALLLKPYVFGDGWRVEVDPPNLL